LGDEACEKAGSEEREVNVCRAPGVVMIAPWIGAGLDAGEAIGTGVIGEKAAATGEIGIEWSVVLIGFVAIPAGGVCLPYLDESTADGQAVLVEDAAAYDDTFAEWLAGVLFGQVIVELREFTVAEDGARKFRE
jgi:hypothetical protein